MNDPHVNALIYRVIHSDGVTFEPAEPLEFETSIFSVRVEDSVARFTMKTHVSKELEARQAVEPFIGVWETWDAFYPPLTGFRLAFERSEYVDRDPPPGNHARMMLQPIQMKTSAVVEPLGLRWYPEPPPEKAAFNPNVGVMAFRYSMYLNGRDSLAAMAYFCLTVLENSTGRRSSQRKHAAALYKVSLKVLNLIGALTEAKGGREARKGEGIAKDFSPSERSWLEFTIRRLILRAAEIAEDPDQELPTITLDHPPTSC